jgi:mannose-6-phosphate isomerase-like protein (cupin superfamily)
MPETGKNVVSVTGDVGELLESAVMSDGARVRTRVTFKGGVMIIAPHIHPNQDERYEVESGRLTCVVNGIKRVVEEGQAIELARGIPHRHYSEGPGNAVAIQTITPGLDFDYMFEGIFGLGSEGRALAGFDQAVQGLIWLRKMKSKLLRAGVPAWIQYTLAWTITPVAYWFGYRAVYQRFSGQEW